MFYFLDELVWKKKINNGMQSQNGVNSQKQTKSICRLKKINGYDITVFFSPNWDDEPMTNILYSFECMHMMTLYTNLLEILQKVYSVTV